MCIIVKYIIFIDSFSMSNIFYLISVILLLFFFSRNVIDFGALHNCIDPQEVIERQSLYNAKLSVVPLSSVANTVVSLRQNSSCLLKDVPGPEKVLSRNIGLPENYRSIVVRVNEIQRLLAAMSVEHKGDLVVKF